MEGRHAKMAYRSGRVYQARRAWEGPRELPRRGHWERVSWWGESDKTVEETRDEEMIPEEMTHLLDPHGRWGRTKTTIK